MRPVHTLDGQRLVRRQILSGREREVLRLVAAGEGNKQIAYQLGISVSTVKTHIAHIATGLALSGRVALTRWALLHPAAFAGAAVDTSLHPPGCPCDGDYCAMMRSLDRGTLPIPA